MKKRATILFLLLIGCNAALLAKPCPPQGDSKEQRIRAIDLLKNRTVSMDHTSEKITLAAILAPGDDTNRFSPDEGATITGYVALVKSGGPETCHCHKAGEANEDTHIVIVANPKDAKREKRHVIVEVTPQSRKAFRIADTATLRKQLVGHWATFTGWMLFDEEHKQNAFNTNPHGTDLWRATCWEIHPVTRIAMRAL